MNRWALARRVAFAVVALLVVISFVFGFVHLTGDPQEALIKHGMANSGASAEEIQAAIREYRAERGRLAPWYVQWARWVVGTATLDWGVSPTYQAPVTEVLYNRLRVTATWVLPGMAMGLVSGVALGIYTALRQHTVADRVGTSVAYFGLSLPNYWLAIVASVGLATVGLDPTFWMGPSTLLGVGPKLLLSITVRDALALALPSLVLATSLFASQAQAARTKALEFVGEDFVKLIHAKGASSWTVARHVGRNAAIPLLSLFFADMLGVLVLNVFVLESVFNIPGIGTMALRAFTDRDLPILLGVTTVVMVVGVLGNLLQDIAYDALDPRVDAME